MLFVATFWDGKTYIKRVIHAKHLAQANKIAESIAKKNNWQRTEVNKK